MSARLEALLEVIFAFEEREQVLQALSYALTQVRDRTERRLIAAEFWHSLNRKKLVRNHEVEPLIIKTLLLGQGSI